MAPPTAIEPVEGLEFRFYAIDRNERPHVHVVFGEGRRGKKTKIKYWLGPPVRLVESKAVARLNAQEVRRAREIIEERWDEIHNKWQEFFGLRAP
ncbi:MAG TPA: DUF4160 domain-containing protein [Pseudomonadota bacterium]|nr:DUF4160 domain-containing protein [Pseudomonadota bacterium]